MPSQTELLFDLGLKEDVIGITKFCIHPPEWFNAKTKVGGTKKLNLTLIDQLNPDLIIANKEENEKDQLEFLMQRFPVWVSDIKNLDDACSMIKAVGSLTEKNIAAEKLVNTITGEFNNLAESVIAKKTKKAVYLIWNEPMMAAGTDTFINDMMMRCGFENVLENQQRYPVLTVEKLKELGPKYILLSSEPFPFNENHKKYFQLDFPASKILLVDGEYFSWYGSRLIKAQGFFNSLLTGINT